MWRLGMGVCSPLSSVRSTIPSIPLLHISFDGSFVSLGVCLGPWSFLIKVPVRLLRVAVYDSLLTRPASPHLINHLLDLHQGGRE